MDDPTTKPVTEWEAADFHQLAGDIALGAPSVADAIVELLARLRLKATAADVLLARCKSRNQRIADLRGNLRDIDLAAASGDDDGCNEIRELVASALEESDQ